MEEIDYKKIVDSTYDCELVRDKNLNLIYVSPSFERIFGYKNNDYISGKTKPENIFYKEDLDKVNVYFESLKKFETIENLELRGITKQNEIIWLSICSLPLKDSSGNNLGMHTSIRDITKRKIAEEDLKILLEKLALSQKASNSGAWDWDMISGKLTWTDEFYNLFGINRKDYPESFETWKNLLHPEDKELTEKNLKESINNKVPLKNYYRIIKPNKEIIWIEALGNTFYKDNKAIRMSGICIDITEKKYFEEKLKETEDRFKILTESSIDGVYLTDSNGNCIYTNESWLNMSGLKSYEVLGKGWINALHPEDKKTISENWYKTVESNGTWAFEYRFITPKGEIRWIYGKAKPLKDLNGKIIGYIGNNTDITEKKKLELELKNEKNEIEKYLNIIGNIIIVLDKKGNITKVNKTLCRLLGYNEKDLIGKNYFDIFIKPDIKNEVFDIFIKLINGEIENTEFYENKILDSKNNERIISWHNSVIKNEFGEITGTISSGEDITEKILIDKKYKEKNLEFEKILESANDAIFLIDKDYKYIKVNKKIADTFHKKEEDLIGISIKENLPIETGDQILKNIKEVFEKNKSIIFEEKMVLKDKILYNSTSLTPINDENGNIKNVLGIVRDITDRKILEEKIKESEIKFKTIFDTSPLIMGLSTIEDGKYVEINEKFLEIFNLKKDDVIGKSSKELNIFSDYKDRTKIIEGLKEKNSEKGIEISVNTKNGSKLFQFFISKIFYLEQEHLLVIGQDITEKKENDKKLKESENFLNQIIENLPNMIFVKDAENLRFEILNKFGEELFGSKKENVLGKNDYDFFPKEQAEFFINKDRQTISNKILVDIPEEPIKTPKGIRILHTKKIPLFDEKGNATHLLGISEDITEKKNFEETLKESEKKYHKLISEMNEGIALHEIIYDKNNVPIDYKIIDVNDSYEKITGIKKEDVINNLASNIYTLNPPPYLKEYSGVAISGVAINFETFYPPMNKHFSISVYSPEKDKFATIFTDITEKKNYENKIKKSANEWETTFNSMQDLISIHDKDYKIIKVNKAFAESFNLKPEEIIGMKCYELVHARSSPLPFCPHKKAMEEDKPQKLEYYDEHLKLYLEVSTNPIYNENNEFIGTVHIVRNISERKNIEKEIITKSQDLEKFNQFAVGREMKMIELKKEINTLLEKINEKPKYEV